MGDRLLPDHYYGPPTLEKLEQRIFDVHSKMQSCEADIVGLIEDVERLKENVHRLLEQLENVQEETGIRADRIAIRAVAYMEKIDAMEARRTQRWERLASGALWAFMTAILVAWLLQK